MFTLNCNGRLVTIERPVVMGILNITPDSFYKESRVQNETMIVARAEEMIAAGATFVDVGGQSTRPGSLRVTAEEELSRVIPAIKSILRNIPQALISIDTFYASVAQAAVNAGACMINDISAGSIDAGMIPAVANMKVPYVLMHMKGEPGSMQQRATYDNVTLEVFDFLQSKIAQLTAAGIHDIIADPGFGFGKTIEHNFELLRNLQFFSELNVPIMVGLSRKSTVYKTLEISAGEALNGSTVLHTMALLSGASMLRVHDVKEACEAVQLVSAVNKKEQY